MYTFRRSMFSQRERRHLYIHDIECYWLLTHNVVKKLKLDHTWYMQYDRWARIFSISHQYSSKFIENKHFSLFRFFSDVNIRNLIITRSIQRTQTPPRLWPFTLWRDLDLSSRPRKLMSWDVAYWIVPWYKVWCLWVYYFTRYHHLFILCDIWTSPVKLLSRSLAF